MKRVFPFVALALVVAGVLWWIFLRGQGPVSQKDLKGDIQFVQVMTASLVDRFGEYVPTAFVKESETTYDALGQVLELKRYRSDNRLDYGIRYTYQSGKLLEEQSFSSLEGALYQWVYKYNAQDVLTELSGYDSSGQLDFHTSYDYDAKGRLIKETSFNPDETISYIVEQSYTRNGFDRRTTYYTSNRDTDYISEERFDKQGNRVLERNLNAEGQVEYEVSYRYDLQGRLLEEIAKNSQGELEYRLTNRYDAQGNLLETVEYGEDNQPFNTYRYTYDDHNNIIERVIEGRNDQKTVYRYSYVYDEKGNWISRETQKLLTKFGKAFFEPIEVAKREIIYFQSE